MSHTPPHRPTTPLRPSSRTSLRSSTNTPAPTHISPLDSLEPQFAELTDSLSDLESNLLNLQLMHESLSRFSENFAAFLYGLEMNAFVVDWPEQPLVESIQRWKARQGSLPSRGVGDETGTSMLRTPTKGGGVMSNEVDSTILSDTTFASMKATPARRRTMAGEDERGKPGIGRGRAAGGNTATGTVKKSGIPARSGSAAGRGARGGTAGRSSGLPMRGRGRGVK